jgi:hypothetical protein
VFFRKSLNLKQNKQSFCMNDNKKSSSDKEKESQEQLRKINKEINDRGVHIDYIGGDPEAANENQREIDNKVYFVVGIIVVIVLFVLVLS